MEIKNTLRIKFLPIVLKSRKLIFKQLFLTHLNLTHFDKLISRQTLFAATWLHC